MTIYKDSVQVDLKGFEELRGKLHDPELLRKPVKDMMFHAKAIAYRASLDALDGGTGAALDSLRALARPTYAEVFSLMAHPRALSIEEGRRPGTEIPFMAALRWTTGIRAVSRYEPTREEYKRTIAALEGIKRRGARAKRFIAKAYEKVEERMPEMIDEVIAKVKARLAK